MLSEGMLISHETVKLHALAGCASGTHFDNAWQIWLKEVKHGAIGCEQMTLYHAPQLGNGGPCTALVTACDVNATLLEEIASRQLNPGCHICKQAGAVPAHQGPVPPTHWTQGRGTTGRPAWDRFWARPRTGPAGRRLSRSRCAGRCAAHRTVRKSVIKTHAISCTRPTPSRAPDKGRNTAGCPARAALLHAHILYPS